MEESEETDETEDGAGGAWNRVRSAWRAARERWWARWAIDLGIVALIFFAITSYQSRNLVDAGESVPELVLQSADGETSPLVDEEADRTVVFVWAPWCGVCSANAGTLGWAGSILGDGVALRSVVYDVEGPAHARRSADEKGVDVPVLLANRRFHETFQVDTFPTFYILSNDHRVLSSTQGYTTTLGLVWRAWF